MAKEKETKGPKILLSVILDMAKEEIGNHVNACMQSNNIPPDLMILVMKGIMLDLSERKINQLQGEIADMQEILKGSEEDNEHD
jgi:hypothetical protein